ncbi:4'-phosphopantetheinyl transferase superfamily protein [Chitinophaga eiseniae]|uniref:4'-phosphopantetheinyl transferase superfamily protein n=1 Tax=Chitinophaga eiseniae TaxID=634771 RepID=A0A1T4LZ52_9BACT|nr:4'-phosphopantetheinyl transferase superfamily protein [Chitinophaga eiseniae]SJZ60010.1 4'-phosphopantetheinyl transferase superfamily protein [Chitinophaga eiseniae]
MIGNDVVDLQLAAVESNWRRKGYLHKIFSPEEQLLIGQATDPDRMVWLLWSAKEAAYKIIHRDTRQRIYAPLQYRVQLSGADAGMVQYQDRQYPFRTVVTGSCLHTIAVALADWWPQVVYCQQPGEELLKDEAGVPFIRDKAGGEVWPASVSHHGHYRETVSLKT